VKILVVNGYVRENKGDAALMSVLCNELQNTFLHADIKIASMESPDKFPTFEKWQNVGSIRLYCADESLSRSHRIARKLLAVIVSLTWGKHFYHLRHFLLARLHPQITGELRALEEADLIVSMGGGYLNGSSSIDGDLNVFFLLAPLRIGQRQNKCVILAPQSIGKFGTTLQKIFIQRVLKDIPLILAREEKTIHILHDLGLDSNVAPAVDSGFLFQPKTKINLRRLIKAGPKDKIVGFTVRQWMDTDKQTRYETAIAAAADYFIERYGVRVVFIPQVTSAYQQDDDRIASRRVHDKMSHANDAHVITEDLNHLEVKALYNSLDFIVGTRFHSVIFSLTSYVPAIAIEYEHKTSGIMADLGLDKWVLNITTVTAKSLCKKIDQIVQQHDSYVIHLQKTLPPYLKQAKHTNTLIRETYEAFKK
jgi:colanic acid/amylovoran biosynthesis protein